MNNNYYWSLIAASKKKLPPIWVEYIVARAVDFSLPTYNTMQENIVADTDHLASVQLYDSNSELVANLRPCLSTEKGHYLEGCLYDVVKKKFYYSQNAGVKYGDVIREVEYIESTGAQYIDTGIYVNSDLETELKVFKEGLYDSSTGVFEPISNSILTSDYKYRFSLYFSYSSRNYLAFTYGLSNTSAIIDAWNKGQPEYLVVKIKNGRLYVNNQYILSQNIDSVFTSNDTISLFSNKNRNSAKCRIYYTILKKISTSLYLADYTPCILSDGTICMWDWISGKAKKNAGTGEFIAGKDVNDLFNVVEKEGVFLNRTTGDGLNVKDKSLAHITSMKGNTLVWNQMINNGDFKNELSDFIADNATINRVEDGIQIIQGNSTYGGFLYVNFKYTDHKYYISTVCRSDENIPVNCGISFLNGVSISNNPVAYNYSNTAFKRYSTVGYLTKNANRIALRVSDSKTSGKNVFGIFKTFVCIDLTEMFGAGNEPETAEEFEAMFPADYYDYDASSLLNVNAGGMKSTNVEKTKWDSLYFVDDVHTLSSLTGKVEGSSVSEVIFPEGMKRIGNVYDELTDVKDGCFTKAVKRIGTRAYQAGDESDATLKTDGTNTYYTLSNATVYTLDTPVPCNYKVWKGGSEIVVPENTEALTAPVDMSVKYIVEEDE